MAGGSVYFRGTVFSIRKWSASSHSAERDSGGAFRLAIVEKRPATAYAARMTSRGGLAGAAAILAGVCTFGTPRFGFAEERPLRVAVSVHAAEGADCISEAELRTALSHQRPPVTIDGEHPELVVDVSLRRRDDRDGWRGTLRVGAPSGRVWGEREVEVSGPSCRAADEALKFMIGLAAQGTLFEAPPPEPSEPSVSPASNAPPRAVSAPSEPEPAPRAERALNPRSAWHVDVDAGALGAIRLLPAPAVGAQVGALLVTPNGGGLRVRVAGYVPQRIPAGSGGATVGYTSTAAAACPLATRARVRLDACLGLDWALLAVDGSGVENGSSTHRSLLDGQLTTATLVELMPNWWLGAYVELTVPLKRDRYVLSRAPLSPAVVFQLPSYSVALGVGARVAL